MSTIFCARCRRKLRQDMRTRGRHAKLSRGLIAIESGSGYSEAAREAGYQDQFQFSRACYMVLGCRPRDAMQLDWRSLLEARLYPAVSA